jgi:hypothetical protein
MVIAPANTGNDKSSKNEVTNIDHTKRFNLCIVNPGSLILKIVTIIFIEPNNEDKPAKCIDIIAISTALP